MYILIERFGNYDECETKVVDFSSNNNELLDKAEKLNSLVAKDKEDFEKAKLLFVEYEALLNARHTIERSRNSKYSIDDINKDFTEKFVIPENLKNSSLGILILNIKVFILTIVIIQLIQ